MTYAGKPGEVGVLNVGAGDTKLSFDPANPADRIRAARIVKDMIRRGYALLIEIEVDGVKKFQRALDFDENVCEYIVADFDPTVNNAEEPEDEIEGKEPAAAASTPRKGTKRVKAETTRAVSVARTSGG